MTADLSALRAMPMADYLALPGISASQLVTALNETPRAARIGGRGSTAATRVGSAVHAMLAGEGVQLVDADDWRTAAARDRRMAIEAAGGIALHRGEWGEAETLVAALRADPLAGRIIAAAARREVVMEWSCPETGLDCKARPDMISARRGLIEMVDVKVTSPAPAALAARAAQFDHPLRVAHYGEGARIALGAADVRYWFIAVDPDPPHDVVVWSLPAEDESRGHDRLRHARALWAACEASGQWPGHGWDYRRWAPAVQEIGMPGWWRRAHDDRETASLDDARERASRQDLLNIAPMFAPTLEAAQ